MFSKKNKKNLNTFILAIVLCMIVLGTLIFVKVKSDDIYNYQHHDKFSKGYSKNIRDMLRGKKTNQFSDSSYERLASLYNLAGLAYFNKARLFFKEENYKKAEAAFRYSLDSLNSIDKLKHYKSCIKYDLFESIIYSNLAWTYYDYAHFTRSNDLKQDLYLKAIENFEDVLNGKKMEEYPFEKIQCHLFIADSYKQLGIIYAQEGRITEATQKFEMAKQNLVEVCKIMSQKENEAGIIASNQIWCDTKSVIHYKDFSETQIGDYKKLQKTINTIYKSIMEEVNDNKSMLTGKNSSTAPSGGCLINQKKQKRIKKNKQNV